MADGKNKGGRPPGRKNDKTLAKEAAREVARVLITAHLSPILEAQIAAAVGVKYLVYRDKKTGKFVPVTKEALASGVIEEEIEVWDKLPSTQAADSLLNRALDLPAKPAENVNLSGALRISWKTSE